MNKNIIWAIVVGIILIGVVIATSTVYNSIEDALAQLSSYKSQNEKKDSEFSEIEYTQDSECTIDYDTEIPTCEIFFKYIYDKKIYQDQITVYYRLTIQEEKEVILNHIKRVHAPEKIEVGFLEDRGEC